MSEQYKVIYSPQAADDLKDIYSYIAFELLVPDTAKKSSEPYPKANPFT
ncbi:type II toxin-antitoxin system RelE/ParE family toxin [Emergencia sp. 1XD21-10]